MNSKEINSNVSRIYRDMKNTYFDSKSILTAIMEHANDNFEILENIQYLIALTSFYKNNYSQRGGEILFEEFSKSIPEFRSVYKSES